MTEGSDSRSVTNFWRAEESDTVTEEPKVQPVSFLRVKRPASPSEFMKAL